MVVVVVVWIVCSDSRSSMIWAVPLFFVYFMAAVLHSSMPGVSSFSPLMFCGSALVIHDMLERPLFAFWWT
eukprot:10341172-Prorocentrum_lima.AAC.1